VYRARPTDRSRARTVIAREVPPGYLPISSPALAGIIGPFAPNQYCGKVSQPVFKVVGGKRKLERVKHVRRCFVPSFESTTLSVTYSAT